MQRDRFCNECQAEIYASIQHVCTPTEAQMRLQMFNTMKAAEDAFKAIYEHLTPKDQEPAPQQNCFCGDPSKPGPHRADQICGCAYCDGGLTEADCSCPEVEVREPRAAITHEVVCVCRSCKHEVHYVDFMRDYNSGRDTCTCDMGCEDPDLPPNMRVSLYQSQMMRGLRGELEGMHKSIALLATYASLQVPGPYGPETSTVRETIKRHNGLAACNQCPGTGWIARDERCRSCNGQGFANL